MDNLGFNDWMYVVSVIGNFGIYFQIYQLFADRRSIQWISPGNTSRLISYIWSTIITAQWIAYGVLYNSSSVLISSVILIFGDLICIGIILISCMLNRV